MALRLSELARRIQGTLVTESDTELGRIAPLDLAMPGDLSFLPSIRHRKRLPICRASAIIIDSGSVAHCQAEPLIVENLLIGCARAGECLPHASRVSDASHRPPQDYQCVDQSATLAPTVSLGHAVTIGQCTIVGSGCTIGDGVRIGSYCNVGANVIIEAGANLGNRVLVGSNSSIGGEPFLYVRDSKNWLKLPSFGGVEIGDDVHLGSSVTVDRGAIGDTSVMSGAKIDNHVHIGHGVVIGQDTAVAARTSIAGEATIGDGCVIGGAVGIGEGVSIAPNIRVTAMSMVTKSLSKSGAAYSSGWPVRRSRQWWRQVSMLSERGILADE